MMPSSEWAATPRPKVRAREAVERHGLFRLGVRGDTSVPWTVEVLRDGWLPYVLEDVQLGDGVTDLGTVRLDSGATLRVRLQPGEKDPRLWTGGELVLSARPAGGAEEDWAGSYRVETSDPPAIVLPALPAGRFDVRLGYVVGGEGLFFAGVVESDGKSTIVVDAKMP
jgi:hypothetical protein